MADDDDYSSSDEEFVAPVHLFPGVGSKTTATIIDAARDIRRQSKIKYKELNKDDVGVLRTQIARARWKLTWETYYTKSLEKDLK